MDSQVLPAGSRRQDTKTSFYVYIHKTLAGRVFYVGKGHARRAWSHKNRSAWWLATVRKHGLKIDIVESHLLEWYAFEREAELISFYGRSELVNMTDGGEGSSGYTPNEETRRKTSQSSRLAHSRPEVRLRHMAATRKAASDPSFAEKISAALLGKKQSAGHVQSRIASVMASPAWRAAKEAMRGRPLPESHRRAVLKALAKRVVCVETGVVFETQVAAAKWLQQTNRKACSANISKACAGVVKTAYGYHWKNIDEH